MAVQSKGALLAGRYRIVRPLGSGGMAVVFLCEDERLGRQVAVKRLHAHSPDDVARRFTREAKVGASLNHPNLVSVFDTTTDEDGVLIVMELVVGETLREALKRGPLPRERTFAVLRDVASALDHAHAHGVVHRDVKPANVLLREDGVAKLVDMGIAVAADSTRITHSGTVLGTAAYMAPEQLEGRKVGAAADVYSLAAVAFEALSGRKPRTGATALEIARQMATEPPPDLAGALPGAPPGAVDALCRGMAHDPADRPRSAGRLVEDLEQGFAREQAAQRRAPAAPVARPARRPEPAAPVARPARQRERAPRREPIPPAPLRRRSRWPALAALLGLLLLAGVVVALSLSGGGGGDGNASTRSKKALARKAKPTKRVAPQASQPAPAATGAPPSGAQSGGTQQSQGGGTGQSQGGVQAVGEGGAAEGARLNDQGYALMRQGRYQEAIPILERAVKAFPAGSRETSYAYALYNLGSSLRRAGRPSEAIPLLERRLQFPNQTAVVQRELDLARHDAGKG